MLSFISLIVFLFKSAYYETRVKCFSSLLSLASIQVPLGTVSSSTCNPFTQLRIFVTSLTQDIFSINSQHFVPTHLHSVFSASCSLTPSSCILSILFPTHFQYVLPAPPSHTHSIALTSTLFSCTLTLLSQQHLFRYFMFSHYPVLRCLQFVF